MTVPRGAQKTKADVCRPYCCKGVLGCAVVLFDAEHFSCDCYGNIHTADALWAVKRRVELLQPYLATDKVSVLRSRSGRTNDNLNMQALDKWRSKGEMKAKRKLLREGSKPVLFRG